MPYRKYSKNKKTYKRPSYSGCGRMVYSDAAKALSLAKGLKRLVNVEIKNFDVQQTNIVVTEVPIIIQLTNVPQGDTTITRDGAQCKVLSLELSILLTRNTSAFNSTVRLMLVCDKQTNQAIYLNTDLLDDITLIDNLVSPYNLDNKYRFNIIWDRIFHVTAGSGSSKSFKKSFRMNKILRFDGNTPSIADLTSNSLSLVQVSNETANQPSITMFSRLRYVDN